MIAPDNASLAARLRADAEERMTFSQTATPALCLDAADALERLTHDLAEAERMARLGDASTQQLRDALDRAIAADNARQRRDIDAEEDRLIADAARAFVAVARRGDLSTDTEECAHAWSALKSAVGP